MDDNMPKTSEEIRQYLEESDASGEGIPEEEVLEISAYPEDRDEDFDDELEEEIEALVNAARQQLQNPTPQQSDLPLGYVSNARNAGSRSDTFQFWAPAEETSLGIGSLVRQESDNPVTQDKVNTYGILTGTDGLTLGLDDYAVHVYEEDAQPPLDTIIPAPSRRRPIVNYQTKVMASTQKMERPVLSGPVYPLKAAELAQVHGQDEAEWPGIDYFLLGLYQDNEGEFGIFAEERARVLGPKQGHIIFSGEPGAGKTSLFLTLVISLYEQLRQLEDDSNDEE
ncbi:MAG: hypothetical protein DPW09_22170 [Anaerolineae bacterium]|nr:hypothetical protein [Anaerolineae bacterium]